MTELRSYERGMNNQRRLGLAVGRTLLWAVEQQARVDDMVLKHINNNDYWWEGARRDKITISQWLEKEQYKQKTKLDWRQYDAERLLSLDLLLNLKDQQKNTITTGKLQSIDLRSASIAMTDLPLGNTIDITFARRLPVPEGLEQSYFGHQLVVNFVVASIPLIYEKLLI